MWVQLVIMIVSYLLQRALAPKPKAPTPATLADINLPTIVQGTPIPVVFGEVWIDNWAVLWYGDLRTTPIINSGKK